MAAQHSLSAMATNEEKAKSVFISYGREVDVSYFVRQLKRDLEANGFSVWLDLESIPSGSDWHGAIGTGLNDCTSFIPVITQKYIGSRFCMNELYTADGDKKLIFPIMYEDVDLVSTEAGRALKFIVSGINWTMFRPGKEEYSDSLQKLIKGMKEKEKELEAKTEPEEEPVVITVGPSSTEPLKMISGIEYPAQIATGRNGEIVVASYMSHEVHIYSHDYQLLHKVGSMGHLDGQFMCPSGIAVDRKNRIFVSSMSKVDVFTMEGQFLTAFGQQGKGPLEFTNATGIAIGRGGEVYIADTQNNRIQVINSDFTYRTCFSEACPTLGSGRLSQPQAIAINSEGNLYVVDMMNHAVQAFTPEGKFLLKFGKYGPATTPGALCTPMAIAIDRQDNVYVGNATGTIGIFDKQGEFLRQFGSYGSELGQFSTIKGLHIDRKGRLYVSEFSSNRIQIFPGSPSMEEQEGEDDTATEEPEATSDSSKPAYMVGPRSSSPAKVISGIREAKAIAVGENGEVIVTSQKEHKVFVYDPKDDYKMTAEIGGKGDLDGKTTYPTSVAVTPDSLVLVGSHYRLQWFTMDGKLVYAVGGRGKEKMNPSDVAIGKSGKIYVIDSNNKNVQIFNGDATYHSCFGFPHLDSEDNNPPNALAINSEGNLYFADSSNNCVHVFSSHGEPLFKFGKSGSWMERGTLTSPQAIAIDSDDNVFVASIMMISIFDKSGSFIRAFGGHGSDPGQFDFINGLHIGKDGNLYVCEYSNNRVQIFEGSEPSQSNEVLDAADESTKTLSSRRPVYTIGPTSDVPAKVLSGIAEPWGIATSSSGDIFIVSKKGKKVVVHNGHNFEFKEEIGRLVWEASRDNDMVDPKGIAISEDGCLLVNFQNQLVKITVSGEVIASVGKKGRRGKDNAELDSPNGIAIGKDGQVYVVDSGNSRVQIFNADLSYRSTCHLPTSLERSDMKKVAVNSEGSVYVTDSRNDCVHVFNCNGKFLFSFGKKSDRGNISSPVAIAIDHEDYLYISSSDDSVFIFDREGCYVRAFGIRGDKPGEFRDIKAMHIDHNGNLFVCESRNNRVQIFTGIKAQDQGKKDRVAFLAQEEAKLNAALPATVLPNGILEPHGIAEGRNGEIVVASSSDHKVFVYDHNHRLMTQFGDKGDLDGHFNSPNGVAVTADNYILVSSLDKLQWFTMEGQLVYAIGSSGKEEMEFDHPDSIAIGRDGKIYVLERRNKRVQILKGDATYHSTFKLQMDQPPEAMAINSENKIFFADTRNNCIQIFSTEGKYLSTLCNRGSKELTLPTAIAIDTEDNVYVGNASGIVAVFNKEGHFLHAFRGSGDASGQFSVITGLSVGQSGCVYVSEYSHNQVQVFRQSGAHVPSVSPSLPPVKTLPYRPVFTVGPVSTLPIKILNGIKQPSGVVTGRNDDIFVTSEYDDKILMYGWADSQPRWQISEIKNPRNPRDKRIFSPSGLAFTSDGYFLVSFQHQLAKMAVDGTVVGFFGNEMNRASKEDLDQPGGIAVGRDGQIYLVDRGNHRVVSFHSNLVYITSFFNPDSKERSYEYLENVALNSAGDLYVTDRRNCNVQVYNHSGKFMFAFGKKANMRKYKRGQLLYPYAIAIDREDFVYVGGDDGIISIFDKVGKFVRCFGGSGDQPGQFGEIHGMHIDNRGQLYVCEWKTNRVQVFQGCQYS